MREADPFEAIRVVQLKATMVRVLVGGLVSKGYNWPVAMLPTCEQMGLEERW